ncbi:MAG TPA: MlaD family protein [Methylophilaceae bacterium]|jgi:phospholipid/cholesterol/gamma-HCH transport system substrate-binding protein
MENRTYAIAVGLFTLLLSLALLLSFWWLSGNHGQNTDYTVVSSLPVTGLSVESAVKYRGVNVGKVTDIRLDPSARNTIRIDIQVMDDLRLSKQSHAKLRMQGVTGLAFIDLDDTDAADAPLLPKGGEIPLLPSTMDKLLADGPQLVSQFDTLLQNSIVLIDSANRLLQEVEPGRLGSALDNLERASGKLEPLLDIASDTFRRMGDMASEQNRAALTETLDSIRQTAHAAQPLLDELAATAREFRNATQEIGTNGRQLGRTLNQETLPRIHQLSDRLDRDLRQLGELLDQLEQHPESVLFGKPSARPGPGEDGFQPDMNH